MKKKTKKTKKTITKKPAGKRAVVIGETATAILTAVKGGNTTLGAIVRATGFPKTTITSGITRLKKQGKMFGHGTTVLHHYGPTKTAAVTAYKAAVKKAA